jgi:hypothetical protein
MARFLSHTPAARPAAERFVTDAANRPARTEQLFRVDDKVQMHEASREKSENLKTAKNVANRFGEGVTTIVTAILNLLRDCAAVLRSHLGAAWSTRTPGPPGSSST